jgi:hypothetical protein
MEKIYPYGFFYSSENNLVNIFGNYSGSLFKLPAFLNKAKLDNFSGNLNSGYMAILKNDTNEYIIEPGNEIDVVAEPGDSFRFVIVGGDPLNYLYSYQIGFRNS